MTPAVHTPALKALSALLGYPTESLIEAATEIRNAVSSEATLPENERRAIGALIDDLTAGDLLDRQELYVSLFDRTRSLSLNLFEHVHGEGRDRGQAMIDLISLYRRHGLDLSASELPDYLPAFLECCAAVPRTEAIAMLSEISHILVQLAARLRRRGSAYAAVISAVLALIAQAVPAEDVAGETDADPDGDDFAALDRAWEDQPVTFGPSIGGSCGGEALIARVRHARRAVAASPEGANP